MNNDSNFALKSLRNTLVLLLKEDHPEWYKQLIKEKKLRNYLDQKEESFNDELSYLIKSGLNLAEAEELAWYNAVAPLEVTQNEVIEEMIAEQEAIDRFIFPYEDIEQIEKESF